MSGPTVRLAPILDTARRFVERNAFAAATAVISTVWGQTSGDVHTCLRAWFGAVGACQRMPDDADAWALEAKTWRALQDAVGAEQP